MFYWERGPPRGRGVVSCRNCPVLKGKKKEGAHYFEWKAEDEEEQMDFVRGGGRIDRYPLSSRKFAVAHDRFGQLLDDRVVPPLQMVGSWDARHVGERVLVAEPAVGVLH